MFGDHNVTFTQECPAHSVLPFDWMVAPGKDNKRDFVFCPTMEGQVSVVNSWIRHQSHDIEHWSIEVCIRWAPANLPKLKRCPTTEALEESQTKIAHLGGSPPETQSKPMMVTPNPS